MHWKHLFLPHPKTHNKARLISWEALLIYILIFVFLQASFNLFASLKPGVLGISSNINQDQLIELTNKKRAELNLPSVQENAYLNKAAEAKAYNMFEENYWAHFAPSGKDPWGFILASGYKFEFAGENLARNFYTSEEVVSAWMNSPTHRENIVNSRYKDIGIAVVEGNLKGQKTTLIVQMFGTPPEAIAAVSNQTPTISIGEEKLVVPKEDLEKSPTELAEFSAVVAGQQIEQNQGGILVNSYSVLKNLGLSLVVLLFILFAVDLYIIRQRGIYHLSARHIPHMALLGIAASALLNIHPGQIL